ncbi:MAG: site-specific integrase [Victivallaceae bacterium]|nr:site-specific integrase [Victivallaceae bacterium]
MREQYIADLKFHRFSPLTVKKYTEEMLRLVACTWKSPAILSDDELRQHFDYLENNRHYSNSVLGIAYSAVKFFYAHTCPQEMPFLKIYRHQKDKTLPVVLSQHEVREALNNVHDIRYRSCLTLIYSCGLRVNEAVNITVNDIDSEQGLIYIRNGKGGKPRAVPLPEHTLHILRNIWQTHHHSELLFPAYIVSRTPVYRKYGCQDYPCSNVVLLTHFKQALASAGCRKNATIHTLRHSYATHLLEHKLHSSSPFFDFFSAFSAQKTF